MDVLVAAKPAGASGPAGVHGRVDLGTNTLGPELYVACHSHGPFRWRMCRPGNAGGLRRCVCCTVYTFCTKCAPVCVPDRGGLCLRGKGGGIDTPEVAQIAKLHSHLSKNAVLFL